MILWDHSIRKISTPLSQIPTGSVSCLLETPKELWEGIEKNTMIVKIYMKLPEEIYM